MRWRFLLLSLALFPFALLASTTEPAISPAPDWSKIKTLAYLVAFMTFAVLVAAVLLITLTAYSWTPYSVIRLLGLILILMIALFLAVVPVLNPETHIQVIGLLGTIGGYLLGKESRELDVNQKDKPKIKAEKPQKLKGAQKLPASP